MNWQHLLPKPTRKDGLEYRAIYRALTKTLGSKPGRRLSAQDRKQIVTSLEAFRTWSDRLQLACGIKPRRKVVISVTGGVATAEQWPPDVVVEIRDYDTEGCDPKDLAPDGCMVSRYSSSPQP